MGPGVRRFLLGGARRLSELGLCMLEAALALVFLAAHRPLLTEFARDLPPALVEVAFWALMLSIAGLSGWGAYTLRERFLAALGRGLAPTAVEIEYQPERANS